MTLESRSRTEDPTILGPTLLLARIHRLPDGEAKAAILEARQMGEITDEQTEILIRELGLAAA